MQLRRGVLIGRPLGIPVVVHGSWIPAALLMVAHFAQGPYHHRPGAAAWGWAVASTAAFFASLVAHELGHAAVARAVGIPVVGITLFIFGGVARIGREPSRPAQEAAIALGGPAVSAALGAPALLFGGGSDVLRTLGLANLALLCFNLLPGFPLDGGRLLRAVLWARGGDPHRAALAAGRAGQGIGAVLAAGGVSVVVVSGGALEGLWLAVVGLFLVYLASSARRAAGVAARLERQSAGEWARPFAGTVRPDTRLGSIPRPDGPYAVARDGRLAGVLLPTSLHAAGGRVAEEVMVPWDPGLTLPCDAPLTRALERLAASEAGVLVVVDGRGAVMGVLDRAALRRRILV